MSKILQKILTFLAKLFMLRYMPIIIAVTGNVGKTSTKEAIACVLKRNNVIRVSGGNLNNELGVPLTILGDWSEKYYREGSSVWFWFVVLVRGLFGLIIVPNYPKILVLEYGADRPGDIERLARNFKPHVGVITTVGKIPVHIEYFDSVEKLANEKAKLIEYLEPNDYVVLNHDDPAVFEMKQRTKAHVVTYGFSESADVKISNFEVKTQNEIPEGITFKLDTRGSFVPIRLNGSLGRSQAFAAAAAVAVGLKFGENLVNMSESLSSFFKAPKGRLRILKGIKNSVIIDDTYNASPSSMHLALDTLGEFKQKRKIAVLGNMLELGGYSIEAHEGIGKLAGSVANILVCIGDKAKFIAQSASGQLSKEKIFTFDTSDEAKIKVQELIEKGDIILVKGSQGMRMEKIVEEIIAEPENKSNLLVRQSKKWLGA